MRQVAVRLVSKVMNFRPKCLVTSPPGWNELIVRVIVT
ncbi:hypothetical protein V1282_003434 [Nitrobacteraceae bacterium AZCC 2146]